MDPSLKSEPRPDTPAAGNALVWMTLSLLAFGVFLVAVPGQDPAGRTWLWVGLVLVVVGGIASALAVRARWAYLRQHRGD
jgi:drug/metabolite transporter (DMT)-like permease